MARYLDNNSCARVKMITFLLELASTYGLHDNKETQALFGEFLNDFVCLLVKEV